ATRYWRATRNSLDSPRPPTASGVRTSANANGVGRRRRAISAGRASSPRRFTRPNRHPPATDHRSAPSRTVEETAHEAENRSKESVRLVIGSTGFPWRGVPRDLSDDVETVLLFALVAAAVALGH